MSGYVPKTDKVSVPMPRVLPTEMESTTLLTKISVTKPTVELAATWTERRVLSDETPILWDFVRPEINVDSPETAIWSLSKYPWDGSTLTDTAPLFSQTRTAFWWLWIVVVTSTIDLPATLPTYAESPPPLVSSLSNVIVSPTL